MVISDKLYVDKLKAYNIKQSISRKDNCYDNSITETFFGRLKNELYYVDVRKNKKYLRNFRR